MKRVLFGLSLLACAAAATAADESFPGVNCISFAPAGFCDGMEYDKAKKATWHNWDCLGSQGRQTSATYKNKAAHTFCDGTQDCNPAAAYGWEWITWDFNLKASTGTMTGMMFGEKKVIYQDVPVDITAGACNFSQAQGGVPSLSR